MRLSSNCFVASIAFGAALAAMPAFAQWEPTKAINIIVPWGAGGSTDQVTRVTAPIIEEALGVSVVVVNQPGASGAIGTQAVLSAPKDGYTWTANAIVDNATYAVSGLVEDTSIDDWHLYLTVANAPVVSVPTDSPFKDFGELLQAFRDRGEEITVATAGITSSGGMAIAALGAAGDFDYRMVSYDGGNPAVISTVGGETMVTTQLAVEQAEMIRGGRLRPLAVLNDTPLEIEGIEPIPPITEWLPDAPVAPKHFGILIPRGVPDEVIETVNRIWEEQVMTSDALKTYARERGAVFDPAYGEEARAKVMPVVITEVCGRVDRGESAIDPKEIGIDCETMSEIE